MRRLLVAAFAGLVGLSAQAVAQTGFFVEAAAGRSKADLGNTSSWSVSDRDGTYAITAGYMFNNHFGMEGGFRNLGDVSASRTGNFSGTLYGRALSGNGSLSFKADGSGWTIGPRAYLPINNEFSVNARTGVIRWESDQSATVNAAFTWDGRSYAANATATEKRTGTNIYLGFGGAYNINKQAAIGLNFTRFKIDTVRVDAWDVSVRFSF